MSASRTSFLSQEELIDIGLSAFGENVKISRFARIYNPEHVSLGSNVRIDDFCIISASNPVKIGSYTHISAYSAIFGKGGFISQDMVTISSRVCIYTESDDYSGRSLTNPMVPSELKPGYVQGPVEIASFSIIGTNSTILPGIALGEGSAIGAHSLVTQPCYPWTIYAGVPAKALKKRNRKAKELAGQLPGIQ